MDKKDSYLKIFGDTVKKARLKKGMTQAQLSTACGYDFTMVSKIEAGKVDLPISKVKTLAKALGENPVELAQDYLLAVDNHEMVATLEKMEKSLREQQAEYARLLEEMKKVTEWQKQNGTANGGGYESQKTEKQSPSPLPEEADQEEKKLMQRLKDSYDSLNSAASERHG